MDENRESSEIRPSWFAPWRWDAERGMEAVVGLVGIAVGLVLIDKVLEKVGQPPWCGIAFHAMMVTHVEVLRSLRL